jgi:flagellar basal-body rod modification protein FlgD
MMDISQTNQSFGANPKAGASASKAGVITSDFETFLRLLTTQMQNQDPLNPMESTEFASQLAQFSAVEQQVRSNELLEGLQAGLQTLSMGQIGSWIGMQARAEMPVNFEGQSVTLAGARHVLADRMELIVRDQAGEVVQQLPIPLSDDSFAWNAAGLDGNVLPHGIYSFTVQNWSGEAMIEERGAMVYGIIQEVAMVDQEVWLSMEGGVGIPADDLLGLGRPVG